MNSVDINNNGRTLAALVNEIKEEAKQFMELRIELLRREFSEKVKHWKAAVPMAAAGALLLSTAYLLITAAAVAGVAILLVGTQFRWFFAFLIVAVVWALVGGALAYTAKRDFENNRVMPEQTIEVLRGDKIWLEQEARNQI